MVLGRALVRAIVCAALLTAAISATANARTVSISPAGEISGASVGRLTFTSELANIECVVTFRGRAFGTATGELLRLEPATNAQIGQVTAGGTRECTNGATVTFLFGERLWLKYKLSKTVRTERSTWYVLNALIQLTIPILLNCLLNSLFEGEYNERTGILRITGIRLLSENRRCPRRLGFQGSIQLTPTLSVTLRDA